MATINVKFRYKPSKPVEKSLKIYSVAKKFSLVTFLESIDCPKNRMKFSIMKSKHFFHFYQASRFEHAFRFIEILRLEFVII